MLDNSRDYVIQMPNRPLVGRGGLAINGGHNVVLIGGEIEIPWQGADPGNCCNYGRGLMLLNQTGTVHVEGLYLHGADLNEGIDIGQPLGATVQIQNVRIENVHARDPDPVSGIPSSTHPDVVQTWAGPRRLLIDGLTGTTDYQGFFLHPNELYNGPAPELFDFRNVEITGLPHSHNLIWKVGNWPLRLTNVWIKPLANRMTWGTLWPSQDVFPDARLSASVPGIVTPGVAGAGYRSPGYDATATVAAAKKRVVRKRCKKTRRHRCARTSRRR
jgi:hypothetical protein